MPDSCSIDPHPHKFDVLHHSYQENLHVWEYNHGKDICEPNNIIIPPSHWQAVARLFHGWSFQFFTVLMISNMATCESCLIMNQTTAATSMSLPSTLCIWTVLHLIACLFCTQLTYSLAHSMFHIVATRRICILKNLTMEKRSVSPITLSYPKLMPFKFPPPVLQWLQPQSAANVQKVSQLSLLHHWMLSEVLQRSLMEFSVRFRLLVSTQSHVTWAVSLAFLMQHCSFTLNFVWVYVTQIPAPVPNKLADTYWHISIMRKRIVHSTIKFCLAGEV